jgi:hypothetical protein
VQPWPPAAAAEQADPVIAVGMIVVGCLIFEFNRRLFRDNPELNVWWRYVPWTFGPLLMALMGLVFLIDSFTR